MLISGIRGLLERWGGCHYRCLASWAQANHTASDTYLKAYNDSDARAALVRIAAEVAVRVCAILISFR